MKNVEIQVAKSPWVFSMNSYFHDKLELNVKILVFNAKMVFVGFFVAPYDYVLWRFNFDYYREVHTRTLPGKKNQDSHYRY